MLRVAGYVLRVACCMVWELQLREYLLLEVLRRALEAADVAEAKYVAHLAHSTPRARDTGYE
jgi:hypothetical protein